MGRSIKPKLSAGPDEIPSKISKIMFNYVQLHTKTIIQTIHMTTQKTTTKYYTTNNIQTTTNNNIRQ